LPKFSVPPVMFSVVMVSVAPRFSVELVDVSVVTVSLAPRVIKELLVGVNVPTLADVPSVTDELDELMVVMTALLPMFVVEFELLGAAIVARARSVSVPPVTDARPIELPLPEIACVPEPLLVRLRTPLLPPLVKVPLKLPTPLVLRVLSAPVLLFQIFPPAPE